MASFLGSSFSQHSAEPQVNNTELGRKDVASKADQQPRSLLVSSSKAIGSGISSSGRAPAQQQHLEAGGQAGCSCNFHKSRQSDHASAPAGSVTIDVGPAGVGDNDVVRSAASTDQRHPAQRSATHAAAAARHGSSSSENDFVIIELQPSTGDGQPGHAAVFTPPAAAAGLISSSDDDSSSATSLRARLQALRAASLARRSVGAASAAASSVADPPQEQRECRICLAADLQDDIVTPCSCSGTVQYAHMECLKAWVAERCSLQCELCGKQYRPEVKQQLEQVFDPRKLRARQRGTAAAAAVNRGGGAAGQQGLPNAEAVEDAEAQPQISWTRFWVHLSILVMLLVAVLYLSLFVNVGVSDNFWLMFLWRAITVILPLFLIIRCVAALYAWRQQYIAAASVRLRSGRL